MVKRLSSPWKVFTGFVAWITTGLKDNAALAIEVVAVGCVAGGIGWIYGPAGLIVTGLLAILAVERQALAGARAELAKKRGPL